MERLDLLEALCNKLNVYFASKPSHGMRELPVKLLELKAEVLAEALTPKPNAVESESTDT